MLPFTVRRNNPLTRLYNSTRALTDWLFSCNHREILARCLRHIQSAQKGIRWPVSPDYITGWRVQLIEVTCLLKISADQVRSKVKGHIINNLLTSSVRSLQENLRPRFDLLNSLSLGQYITFVWDFPVMTSLLVNEKFVLSLLYSLRYGYPQKTFWRSREGIHLPSFPSSQYGRAWFGTLLQFLHLGARVCLNSLETIFLRENEQKRAKNLEKNAIRYSVIIRMTWEVVLL